MKFKEKIPEQITYQQEKIIIKLIWVIGIIVIFLIVISPINPPKIIYTLKTKTNIIMMEGNIYYMNENTRLCEMLQVKGKVDIQITNTEDYILIYEGKNEYGKILVYYYIININGDNVDEI